MKKKMRHYLSLVAAVIFLIMAASEYVPAGHNVGLPNNLDSNNVKDLSLSLQDLSAETRDSIAAGGGLTAAAVDDTLKNGRQVYFKIDTTTAKINTAALADAATALAANGANAAAGNAILGVDASGAAEGAFDVWTEAENTAAGYITNATETDPTLTDDTEIILGTGADTVEVIYNGVTPARVMVNGLYYHIRDLSFGVTNSGQYWYTNFDGPADEDQKIYFRDGGVNTDESIAWNNTSDRFDFSNDVNVTGGITLSGTIAGDNITDGTVDASEIEDGTISEADIKAVNAATDEDILTYESTTGDYEWHTPAELGLAAADSSFELMVAFDSDSTTCTSFVYPGYIVIKRGVDSLWLDASAGIGSNVSPKHGTFDLVTVDTVDADKWKWGAAILTLPQADGTVNQILKTDGAGNLDWVAQTGGSGTTDSTYINDGAAQYGPFTNDMFKWKESTGITITRDDSTTYDVFHLSTTLGTSVDLTTEVTGNLPDGNIPNTITIDSSEVSHKTWAMISAVAGESLIVHSDTLVANGIGNFRLGTGAGTLQTDTIKGIAGSVYMITADTLESGYIAVDTILISGDIITDFAGTALSVTAGVLNVTETDPAALLTAGTDNVKDTHVDWGVGASQVSAVDVPIADAGVIITATEVEGALQENRTAINLNTAKVTNATHTGDVTGSTGLTIAAGAVDSAHFANEVRHFIVDVARDSGMVQIDTLSFDASFWNPDGINDTVMVKHFDDLHFPNGFEILQLAITTRGSGAYTVTFAEYSSALAWQATTDSIVQASGYYTQDATQMDGTLDANDYLFAYLPATDIDNLLITVIGYVK